MSGLVGLVPARGGSKGIPGKNLSEIAGKPLLVWTIEAALSSQTLDQIVVSTDCAKIAAVARGAGADVLDRPSALAADDTPMIDVVRHAVTALRPSVVVLLQPTSPLRRPEDIDAAVETLLASDADAVVSVVPVPHRYMPDSLMELDGGRIAPVDPGSPTSRQAKGQLYARNGPAVLALRTERIGDSLYGGDVLAYAMDARDSLDVDTPFELELADLLMRARLS